MTREEPILNKLTEIIEPLRHLAFDEMSDVEWQILQVIDKYAEQEPTEKPMCDRNICISNEYNGIGCDECIVNKAEQESCDNAISQKEIEHE